MFERDGVRLLFEAGAVPLRDGELFRPEKEAKRRWVARRRSGWIVLGFTVEALYSVEDDWIRVRYPHCESTRSGNEELWSSTDPPNAWRADPEEAMEYLLAAQYDVPEELERAVEALQPSDEEIEQEEAEADAPTMSVEEWAEHHSLGRVGHRSTNEIDFHECAVEIRDVSRNFVHDLRRWSRDERGGGAVDFLEARLFGRYVVDPEIWPNLTRQVPPEHATLLEVQWPEELDDVREAIESLARLVAVPLAAYQAAHALRPLGSDLHGTEGDRSTTKAALVALLPDVESAVVGLTVALATADLPATAPDAPENEFRFGDGVWSLRFGGRGVQLNPLVGLDFLAHLLHESPRAVSCVELSGAVPLESSDDVFDDVALRRIHDELQRLEGQLDRCRAEHDVAGIESKEREIELLREQLQSGTGLGGKSRKLTDITEKARKRVGNAIERALEKIGVLHPPMGQHLRDHVTLGTECRYEPPKPVVWTL